EKPMVIGYFGPETTFTHMAAYKTFGSTAKYLPLKTIRNVFEEVEKKRVDYGVVPIENSTEGVVNHTLDMFVDSNTKICAETFLGIAHYLLSRNTEIGEIKRVYSHQQPLAQCRNWLDSHIPGVELIETRSTAEAAFIATREHLSAAIASELAAKKYNLNVLAKNIEDLEENITRFLVIGQNITQPSGSDKTSVMLSIKDRVGALHDILLPFSKNKLNLTKIESRPSRKRVWEYVFFVDIEGHCDDSSVKKALKMLEKYCVFVKVLGSYPKV
ncbi:MAG: prephenate dehydratase, partial [Elusimicrobiota bacterium]